MENGFANSIINLADPTGLNPLLGITPACAAFVLADGPLPVGDSICLGLITTVGVGAIWSWLMALQQPQPGRGIYIIPQMPSIDTPDFHPLNTGPNRGPTESGDPGILLDPNALPQSEPQPDDDDEDNCLTNSSPISSEPFANVADLMCNIQKHTTIPTINPAAWLASSGARIALSAGGKQWVPERGIPFTVGAYIGKQSATRAYYGLGNQMGSGETPDTPLGRRSNLNEIFINQPGQNRAGYTTRADIMAVTVHELRHAGQRHSLFSYETVLGKNLTCPNINRRIGEVDALIKTNQWMLGALPRLLPGMYRIEEAVGFFNGGLPFTEATAEASVNENYFNLDDPAFDCPNSLSTSSACIDPLVSQHI